VKFVVEISGAKKDLYPTTSDFLLRILPMPHTHYFVCQWQYGLINWQQWRTQEFFSWGSTN